MTDKKIEIESHGYITINNSVVIGDPYYPISDNNSILLNNIEPGRYLCLIKSVDEIIQSMMVIHESVTKLDVLNLRNNWFVYGKNLYSRDGIIGLFNASTYFSDEKYSSVYDHSQMGFLSPAVLAGDVWYNVLSKFTLNAPNKCIKSIDDIAIYSPRNYYQVSGINKPGTGNLYIIKIAGL